MFYKVELADDKPNKEIINNTGEGIKEIEEVGWMHISNLKKENCHPIIYNAIEKFKN